MRKTTLAVLIVIIFTAPCLGQLEPQGQFTINNTLWAMQCEENEYKCIFHDKIGFSNNQIYFSLFGVQDFVICSKPIIIDLGLICFYKANCLESAPYPYSVSGIASSYLGIGINRIPQNIFASDIPDIDIMKKVEDDWVLPEETDLSY